MNPTQLAQQIKHVLATLTWPSGSQDEVFGAEGVFVFAGPPTEEQIPAGFPWALVWPDAGTPDEDDPDLIEQNFTVAIGAEVAGDPHGEFALIGGSIADIGKSANRGLGEVMGVARPAVEGLVGTDGAQIHLSSMSTGAPAALGGGRHIAVGELGLRGSCSSSPHYSAPQEISRASAVFSWDGSRCSTRFDFLQYRIVHKSGSVPTDPSDGTTAYTGTDTTADLGTTTAGHYYVVFADYNSRGGSTVEGSSSPEVGSYLGL